MIRGATAYELAFGRVFTGELCEFGEPVFGYVVPATKAAAMWKRMLFLGKAEFFMAVQVWFWNEDFANNEKASAAFSKL